MSEFKKEHHIGEGEELEKRIFGSVLVVGGGIGGIQASLDLAESGFKVYLVDKSSTIGGVMAQLDKTFPTNDCSMCILSPKLVECDRHLNIEILTCSEVKDVTGEVGNFKVLISQSPRYIDAEKCTGCGLCVEYCPVEAIDSFNKGLSERKAIYIDYPQAVPLLFSIDREKCIGCGLCENICTADALNYSDTERTRELNVGAIILAPGVEAFDPIALSGYGYGRYANVVTSLEFERILSASGPFMGRIQRPSDGNIAKKIAFIQCVGSRDINCGNLYCSSVCCMYATKEAVIAKEHMGNVESTIFYMDMRAYGKDFDKYIERAKDEHGIRFVRCRVSNTEENPDTNDLLIKYIEEDKLISEQFDLVVLSIGFKPSKSALDLANKFSIELDEYGFNKPRPFSPLQTSREGIFACGVFSSPMDIPETVIQASASACSAGELLSSSRNRLVKVKEYPDEIDISGKPPRIGVFICQCGINIGGVVNVPEVLDYSKNLKSVVYTSDNLYTCSSDTQEKIMEAIKENDLNRVVVASCSPRTHEVLFQETIREAGLNRYLFEMANIRDQCSWVHMHEPKAATEKAKDLVRMAVAKARGLEPLKRPVVSVTPRGMIMGGGLSGMTAALALADQGFEVFLVEREKKLGGFLRKIHYSFDESDPQALLKNLIEKVNENELIHVYLDSEVEDISGYVGNFKSKIASKDESQNAEVEHGVVIVSTGAEEYQPDEYLHGKDSRVMTQLTFEGRLASGEITKPLGNVVIIQCVGSRCEERPYCSRVCCGEAIKNALHIKETDPGANVFVLYKDIRTYGLMERHYKEAREAGVMFIVYDDENKPRVFNSRKNGDKLNISVHEQILGEELLIDADLVVLSTAIISNKDNNQLAKKLKVPLNEDGFFLEAHVKLRPVDFATDGVYVCGMAHSPKFIEESISQAKAAVSRACTILTKEEIEAEGITAIVDKNRCSGCRLCIMVCPYSALEMNEEENVVKVNTAMCKGCGACSSACRSSAIDIMGYTDDQIYAVITSLPSD